MRFAVIASTIASLVVFLPLAFTSDLSYAILGDLAKTVVFSHGFSAFVALILVPTVRLHLMSRGGEKHFHSPIEGRDPLARDVLTLRRSRLYPEPARQAIATAGAISVLALLLGHVLPRLPKEVIGTPDTDWTWLVDQHLAAIRSTKQMESQAEEIEAQLLGKFGDKIQYTFTQISGPNRASIMARLKDKSRDASGVEGHGKRLHQHALREILRSPLESGRASDPGSARSSGSRSATATVHERSRIAEELRDWHRSEPGLPANRGADPEAGYQREHHHEAAARTMGRASKEPVQCSSRPTWPTSRASPRAAGASASFKSAAGSRISSSAFPTTTFAPPEEIACAARRSAAASCSAQGIGASGVSKKFRRVVYREDERRPVCRHRPRKAR